MSNEDLREYLLKKVLWASSHRHCVKGAHNQIVAIESGMSIALDCPTERMFKLYYNTLVESSDLTENEIEKYLEEMKKK